MTIKSSKDFKVGIFLFLVSIVLYIMTGSIKVSSTDALGPQFLPKIISILLGISALLLIKKSIGKETDKCLDQENKTKKEINKALWITIILLVLYVSLINIIGFIAVSILYLFCQIRTLSLGKKIIKKEIIIEIVVSILVPILVYRLFYDVFNIFLPTGIF